jgi:conjugal transfer pilus assembly protein TraB
MENNKTKIVISKQWINLGILVGIVLLVLAVLVYLMADHTDSSLTAKNDKANFSNPLSHVDAESVVLEKTQKQLMDATKKTDSLQQQVNQLSNSKSSDDVEKRIAALEKELTAKQNPIQNELSGIDVNKGASIAGGTDYQGNIFPAPMGSNSNQTQMANSNVPSNTGIREDALQLSPSDMELANLQPMKNPDTYVPSGTYVKAVMLGGSDAPAAVMSQSNPETMVFRLIASGTLPNHKKSHLKDCVVVASVVGDISSERGRIKAESISCTFPNNEVVDQEIAGWVFGGDGKFGVRGIPVWREGALLQRAFTAGTLSGLSEGISQTYTTNSISAQGNVQTVNPANILQYGAAKGTGKAMDKLADYNIQRAEQYHPIIQLSAGSVVDVVFVKGFYLDGKKHESNNKSSAIGSYGSDTNTPTLFPSPGSESSTLPLSPEMIKRVQEKSKELGLKVTESPTGL